MPTRGLEPLAKKDGVIWTLTHTYYANMGGFVLRGISDASKNNLPYHLTAYDIRILREQEQPVIRLPNVQVGEIDNLCKGDPLVKAVVVA